MLLCTGGKLENASLRSELINVKLIFLVRIELHDFHVFELKGLNIFDTMHFCLKSLGVSGLGLVYVGHEQTCCL